MEESAPKTARSLDGAEKPRRRRWKPVLAAVSGAAIGAAGLYLLAGYRTYWIPSASMAPTLRGPDPGRPRTEGDWIRVERLLSNRFRQPARGEIWVFRAPREATESETEFIQRVIGLPGETVEVVGPALRVDGRTLLKLGTEPGGVIAEDRPDAVSVDGSRAEIESESYLEPLSVYVALRPEVEHTPFEVKVNGKALLEDPYGGISAERELAEYGGAPEVEGWSFLVQGEPRLLVARGEKLELREASVLVDGKSLDEPYTMEPPNYEMPPRRLGPDEYFLLGDNRNNSNDSHVWGPLPRSRFVGRAEFRIWPLDRLAIL